MAIDFRGVLIVGCGPGSAEYVTLAAREAVSEADLLFGSERLLSLFSESRAQRLAYGAHIEPHLDALAGALREGKRPAVLVSGDPGLFSLAHKIIRRFGRERCRIIPAVSSVQVAFARLGLDWSDARILSAHARIPTLSAPELGASDKLAILAGTEGAIQWIAAAVRELRASHAAFLCENLTLPGERVAEVSGEELVSRQPGSLAIVVLVRRTLFS